jgi:hypothetical protein
MRVSGELHAPATLKPQKGSFGPIRWVMDPGTGLGAVKKIENSFTLFGDVIPCSLVEFY